MNNMYKVCEIFESIQGEGVMQGRHTLFVRLAGCNLACPFCDTNHEDYTEMTGQELVNKITSYKPSYVVFTGGEPTLHDLRAVVEFIRTKAYHVCDLGLETNGTVPIAYYSCFDHITVSPKPETDLTILPFVPDELRVLVTETGPVMDIERVKNLCVRLSPVWSADGVLNPDALKICLDLVKQYRHYDVRLSVQVHKFLGVQ